jgi:hypothetical protein
MRIFILALCSSIVVGGTASSHTVFADPPARVGRINEVSGEVSFRPAGVEEWVPASVNRPLMTGDQLWSAQRSRAELHVGSTAIRIGHDTDFSALQLDDRFAQLRLGQGSVDVKVRRLEPQEVIELDLPNAAVQILHPGSYRVDFFANDARTRVVVRTGEAQVTANGEAQTVEEGQMMLLLGADAPEIEMQPLPGFDEFDRWSVERDQREDNVQSLRYVPREMTGYEDLDAHGSWGETPEYGAVWYPNNVGYGWQPYRSGHWAWIDPYGWTWCGDEPWGFAPYHYGRWAYVGNRWGWMPGRFTGRPVYAPALVGWVGGSGGVVVEGGGPVGWFPLGPREVYVPAYGVSDGYYRSVNAPYARVTTVREYNQSSVTYANRGYVTAVPRETFVGARPVQGAVIAHPVYNNGGTVMAHPMVAPTGQSVVAHPVGRAYAPPPAQVGARPVVAVHTPPPAPQPFAQRQQAIQDNGGRPVPVQARPVESHPLVRPMAPVREAQPMRQAEPMRPQEPARPPEPAHPEPHVNQPTQARPIEPSRSSPAPRETERPQEPVRPIEHEAPPHQAAPVEHGPPPAHATPARSPPPRPAPAHHTEPKR